MTNHDFQLPSNMSDQGTMRKMPVTPEDMKLFEIYLEQGTIHDLEGIMRWGSNYAALVNLKYDDHVIEAVYKPQRGERPLWDFPAGTLCYREVLSYYISEELGWQLVPPTTLRNGPHGIGSFQLFVPHDPEIHYFTLDDRFEEQLKKYAVFDAIINNADRKGGHILLGERNKLWGIDHGLTFHPTPKLRTVVWDFADEAIPEVVLRDVARLHDRIRDETNPARLMIDQYLNTHETESLLVRIKYLLDCKRFPKPGAGPSFPWPPV